MLGACFFDLFGISLPPLRMQTRKPLQLPLVILQQGFGLVVFDLFVNVGLERSFQGLEEVSVVDISDAKGKMYEKFSLFYMPARRATDIRREVTRCRPVWVKRTLSW